MVDQEHTNRTVGASGLNVMKDGKEVRAHNPHNTLVYSMAKFTPLHVHDWPATHFSTRGWLPRAGLDAGSDVSTESMAIPLTSDLAPPV